MLFVDLGDDALVIKPRKVEHIVDCVTVVQKYVSFDLLLTLSDDLQQDPT